MARSQTDWTATASKWVVVLILGGSSVGGVVWTIRTRPPRTPTVIEPIASPNRNVASREPARPGPIPVEASPVDPVAPDLVEAAPIETGPRLININTASAAELELLPRIGPTLAGRIVADREANGLFASLDDLDRVRGIGPKTIEKFRGLAVAK